MKYDSLTKSMRRDIILDMLSILFDILVLIILARSVVVTFCLSNYSWLHTITTTAFGLSIYNLTQSIRKLLHTKVAIREAFTKMYFEIYDASNYVSPYHMTEGGDPHDT